ncbi:MAG: hypothetical protein JNL07_10755 [Rhodospirillales bacterium]|nr:hypothetical protein [Rhodospirillales bacterium]
MTVATIEAQIWCDKMENKEEMCQILSKRQWFNVPVPDIYGRIKGDINYGDGRKVAGSDLLMKFFKDHASYPFQSHELWFLTENQRWGNLPSTLDTKDIIAKVNREDIWRAAAKIAGVAPEAMPAGVSRGKETFFDGKVFDPENPKAYLASLAIKKAAA